MYYTQPYPAYYYPYQSNREEMMSNNNMQQMQMMEMMKEHMRMTEEIRQMVYEINERSKQMESNIMG
ncbi:hypothetical protein [Oceanobacillus kimchii]|uniref:Spore coat protein n=1 Tax=Oceanobacillus kimchii TaxID=746691 RepID=A0ABQ5TE47_9BACI|nr:hypothetical protein [Oceanobacillus kimchii]GLO65078.1 hypothetical protein MACH08_08620 [Oceanobacillus kimchii]